jgi:PAS domain S-box-containing protein
MYESSSPSVDSPAPLSHPRREREALLAIIDDIGNVIASTQEFCELCGYGPEEMSFRNWWIDLTPPESISAELRALGGLAGREGLQFFDHELYRADGERMHIGVLARESYGVFILEIARMLPCLESRISPLYGFSEALSMERAIVATDAEGRVSHANSSSLSIFRYADEAAVLGRSALEFLAPECAAAFRRKIDREREGVSADDDMTALRGDGVFVRVRLRSLPLVSRGRFQGTIAFVGLAPEEERGQRDSKGETLAPRSCQSLDCLDGLPLAICSLRPDGSIRCINTFGRSFLGIGEEDIRRGVFVFERLREDMVGRCRSMLDEALRGAELRPIIMDVETPEGERRPAIWCFSWDREKDGLTCIILKADDLLASAMMPDEGFYASYSLTSREREVADFLILGFEYKEIADRMGIGLPTVRSHAQSVYARLGIHSRAELIELSGRWHDGQGGEETRELVARFLRTR